MPSVSLRNELRSCAVAISASHSSPPPMTTAVKASQVGEPEAVSVDGLDQARIA
jgi:hypothetical protein